MQLALILGLGCGNVLAAELSLVVQPMISPERAKSVYQPLVDYLSKKLDANITLHTPRDFHHYWQEIRAGDTPDLVLDEAHLTALQVSELGYTPIAHINRPMHYSLVTTAAYAEDDSNDFVSRIVSTMAAPSLGYLIIFQHYTNPMAQPRIASSAQSGTESIQSLFAEESQAAMAPSWLSQLYPNLHIIFSSVEFPGLTISVAPGTDLRTRQLLRDALLDMHQIRDNIDILQVLPGARFIAAQASEYTGYTTLLQQLKKDL